MVFTSFQSGTISLVESFVMNPLSFMLIFVLLCIAFLFLLLAIGMAQKTTYNQITNNSSSFREDLKFVGSRIINLSLIGVFTLLIASVPLQLFILILVPIKASIIETFSGINLDLAWDLFEAITFSFIFALAAGPGFLSISRVCTYENHPFAVFKGWKLVLNNPPLVFGSMIIIWLSYLSIFIFGRFILFNILSLIISSEIILVILFCLSLLVILFFTLFILSPMLFTVMYIVYDRLMSGERFVAVSSE